MAYGIRIRRRTLIDNLYLRALVFALGRYNCLIGVIFFFLYLGRRGIRYNIDLLTLAAFKHPQKYFLIVIFELYSVLNVVMAP